jgi:hypothetical protein
VTPRPFRQVNGKPFAGLFSAMREAGALLDAKAAAAP